MSSEQPGSSKEIPRDFGIAFIIFLTTAILPTVGFIMFGDDLFGERAFAKLLLLSSMGGALGSAICAKGIKQRLIAIFPGILMGIGVPLAFILYIGLLQRQSLMKIEFCILVLIGVFPGAVLRAGLIGEKTFKGTVN